jgi:hypothetical protein
MISTTAIVAGALIGGGIAVAVRAAVRPQADLAATLERINRSASEEAIAAAAAAQTQDERVGAWLVTQLQGLPGVTIPYTNLRLVGQTPAKFMLNKTGMALLGLLVPTILIAPWYLIGFAPPLEVPAIVGLLLGVLLWFVPDLALRDQARRAREQFDHAIAAYLDLVALERAGDSGPTEALERAAAIGRGWCFARIQQALAAARVNKVPPWDGLSELAEQLGLTALLDVADIMRLSAHDGAAVYTTLRARAKSLRTELMAKESEEANAASEKMTAPAALLSVLVMLLIAYPAIIRILQS